MKTAGDATLEFDREYLRALRIGGDPPRPPRKAQRRQVRRSGREIVAELVREQRRRGIPVASWTETITVMIDGAEQSLEVFVNTETVPDVGAWCVLRRLWVPRLVEEGLLVVSVVPRDELVLVESIEPDGTLVVSGTFAGWVTPEDLRLRRVLVEGVAERRVTP